jgi:hypothetical protein
MTAVPGFQQLITPFVEDEDAVLPTFRPTLRDFGSEQQYQGTVPPYLYVDPKARPFRPELESSAEEWPVADPQPNLPPGPRSGNLITEPASFGTPMIESQITPGAPKLVTDYEMAGALQYLYDFLKEGQEYAIQLLHSSVCNQQQLMLQLLRSLTESHPETIVHTLLNDGRYAAIMNGDLLSVSRCLDLPRWRFLPQNETDCTAEYPIEYIYLDEKHQAYVRGVSREIVKNPTPVSCSTYKFYFDDGTHVIIPKDRTTVSNTPILQIPDDPNTYQQLPEIAFNTPGHINASSLDGTTSFMNLLRQTQSPSRLDNIIQAQMENRPLSAIQTSITTTLRNMAMDPLRDIM